MVRAGPVLNMQHDLREDRINNPKRCDTGLGICLSLSSPKIFQRRINIEIYLVRILGAHQQKHAVFWNLESPRIVSQHARIFRSVRAGSIAEVLDLFNNGQASPRDVMACGLTLLHAAASSGKFEVMDRLIRSGVDVNASNDDGETPLHRAISKANNYAVAKLLIENGAHLANCAVDGRTPLHAIFNDTVAKVLAQDCVENVSPDADGLSLIHYLAWSSKTTPEIFEHGRTRDTVTDIWTPDDSGNTCLLYAASRGNSRLVAYLLEQASPSEIQRSNYQGRTALHYAMHSSRMAQVVPLLMAKGINIYAKDINLENVLHYAARWRKLEDVMKLAAFDSGGRLLTYNRLGQLPSHLAHQYNSNQVCQFLLELESTRNTNRKPTYKALVQDSSSTLMTRQFNHPSNRISQFTHQSLYKEFKLRWSALMIPGSWPYVALNIVVTLTLALLVLAQSGRIVA